jgi:hypothetical protein
MVRVKPSAIRTAEKEAEEVIATSEDRFRLLRNLRLHVIPVKMEI